jgi:hypothetical protein
VAKINFAQRARGDTAEISVHGCILGFFAREDQVRVRLGDGAPAKLIVRFKAKASPALRWLDDENLLIDHGEVTWLTRRLPGSARSRSPQLIAAPSRASEMNGARPGRPQNGPCASGVRGNR